jgi:hypothetical protein
MRRYNSGKISPPTEVESLDKLEARFKDALGDEGGH